MKYQMVTISVYLELRFIIDISWTSSKSLQKNSRNQNNKTMQTRLTRTSSAGQKWVHLERPPIKCQELRRLIIGGSGGKICSRVNKSNSIGWLESQDAKKSQDISTRMQKISPIGWVMANIISVGSVIIVL